MPTDQDEMVPVRITMDLDCYSKRLKDIGVKIRNCLDYLMHCGLITLRDDIRVERIVEQKKRVDKTDGK
jgi:hypothetical protein